MKSMSRLLLSLAAVAACATANAAPFDSADQARRDRNREEVMAKHGLNSSTYRSDARYHADEKKTVKSETDKAVAATKGFGHRTAEKMREIGAKTNAKFDKGQGTTSKAEVDHGQK